MAQNKFQVKRTSTSGRTPNTTHSGNSQYILPGELALNMADHILFTSNGADLVYIGSNQVNLSVSGNATINAIIANSSIGAPGQVLASNGSGLYWQTVSGTGTVTQIDTGNGLSGGPINTTGTISVKANTGIVANSSGLFVNSAYIGTLSANNSSYLGGKAEGDLNVNSAYSATISLLANNSTYLGGKSEGDLNVNTALVANLATYVVANNGIVSNSSGVFVKAGTGITVNASGVHATSGVNTYATYTWTNTHVFSNSVTFNSNVVVANSRVQDLALTAAFFLMGA